MNEAIRNMKTRRSVRKFKPDAVPEALIEQVIEAGTFAASGHDRQPWAIVAVTDPEVIARLRRDNAAFFDMKVKDPFYGAPVVIIVLTKKTTPTYVYDGSLVIGNMMLAAHSLGLGSCWIHRARQEFEMAAWRDWLTEIGVEGDYEGIGNCIIGYSAQEAPQPKPRKPDYIRYID